MFSGQACRSLLLCPCFLRRFSNSNTCVIRWLNQHAHYVKTGSLPLAFPVLFSVTGIYVMVIISRQSKSRVPICCQHQHLCRFISAFQGSKISHKVGCARKWCSYPVLTRLFLVDVFSDIALHFRSGLATTTATLCAVVVWWTSSAGPLCEFALMFRLLCKSNARASVKNFYMIGELSLEK